MVALALFQPEIPGNAGALMRLSACLATPLHIIGPTAFRMNDRALRRAGLDYRDSAQTTQHADYSAFEKSVAWLSPRLILMTTKASKSFTDYRFDRSDIILLGQETAGAPKWLHERADQRLIIPMAGESRSLNLAIAASLVLGEALRQTDGYETLN